MLAANPEADPNTKKELLPAQADTGGPSTVTDFGTRNVLDFVQGSTGA